MMNETYGGATIYSHFSLLSEDGLGTIKNACRKTHGVGFNGISEHEGALGLVLQRIGLTYRRLENSKYEVMIHLNPFNGDGSNIKNVDLGRHVKRLHDFLTKPTIH